MSHQVHDTSGSFVSRSLHKALMRTVHLFRSGYWRGHHVHSPYVFHVVRDVISTRRRDKTLVSQQKAFRKQLSASGEICSSRLLSYKYSLLLSRIVADMQPECAAMVGDESGFHSYCVNIGSLQARTVAIGGEASAAASDLRRLMQESHADALKNADFPKTFMLFLGDGLSPEVVRQCLEAFLAESKPLSIVFICNIFGSPAMTSIWRALVADKRVSTTIELASHGLAYVRSGCQKEHYNLCW